MMLTLVTLNFNSTKETLKLLESLRVQTDSSFDIIVVDNDSEALEREKLGAHASTYSQAIDIVYSPKNLGFSGGNNVGIRKALAQHADWVLLINNDTTVSPEFIRDVRSQLAGPPRVIGLPIREGAKIAYAGNVKWLVPTLPHHYTLSFERSTAYAIGAGLVIHRDIFERIGFLDEDYFLYFEDADFSQRVRRAGIPLEFFSAPCVTHAVSASTKTLGAPLLLRYHLRNAIRFNLRYGPWWAQCALPVVLAWIAVKQCIKWAIGHNRLQSRALLAGLWDGYAGNTGRIRTLPSIAIECESLEDASWGVARQIRGLLTAMVDLPEVRAHYEIVAYFKSRIPDEPWLNHTSVRAVLVRPFRWLPESFSLYFYIFFPIRVWFDRPAVTLISNYMLPLIFKGRSIVMLTEDVWFEIRGNDLPLKYRAAYLIFSTWASWRATRIMTLTHASALRVAELFGIAKRRIIVNELAVSPARHVKPRAGSYVLYVGQGLPRRHLRETIQAFALIAPHHPHLTFLAIGPDKYQPPILSQLVSSTNAALGRTAITWIDRVGDVELAEAYAGAQLLVYVSDMEAFGLPPMEALSYRVPSVVMDAPVHRELFGDYAFYTVNAEPATLASVIERGLSDETHRNAIREKANSIISRYTWEAHAHRMLAYIKDILHPQQ